MSNRRKLEEMIRQDLLIMHILEEVRELELPNWYVGGGLIRTRIWDAFHNFINTKNQHPIRDVDIVYYYKDKNKFSKEKLKRTLDKKIKNMDWDIKNSAFLHEWYKEKLDMDISPLTCVEDDIDCWPETCTCIAVRLLESGSLKMYTPWGADDLMNMIFKRNANKTRNVTPELFAQRVVSKKIKERWPKVKIVYI